MNLTNKLLGLSLAAVVGFASYSFADSTPVKGSKKSLESRIAELEAKLKDAGSGGVKGSGIKISGYVDTSYLVNLSDRDNAAGGAPISGSANSNTGRVFDNQRNAFNLNAVKLTIEKAKDNSKYPAGFRVDTIYGEDANVLDGQVGSNDSRLFLEQAYINLGVPIENGIDIKIGKMVSLVGYEVIESPANWQFSRSDAFRLQPLTQTGATIGYKWNDRVTTTVGVVNGWDSTDVANGAANGSGLVGALNRNSDLAFVGRIDFSAPRSEEIGNFDLYAAAFYGNEVLNPTRNANLAAVATSTTLNGVNCYVWDIGGTWDKPFGVKQLTLGHDYLYRLNGVNTAAFAANTPANQASISAHAASLYGKWDWNKWLTSSGRFSYSFYDTATQQANGAIVGQQTLSPLLVPTTTTKRGFYPQSTDMYSFTLTQGFNVWKDTLVRIEWRHDWTDSKAAGFGLAGAAAGAQDDIRQSQDTLALNVVYSF